MIYLQDGETQSTIFKAQLAANWRIQKLYEFLQISPTYRKASLFHTNKHPELGDIPNDFDTVCEVYSDLGDVWEKNLEEWWLKTASPYFDPIVEPTPKLVSQMPELAIRDLTQIDKHHLDEFNRTSKLLGEYWVLDYARQLFPNCALVAVPLRGEPTAMKSKLNKLVDQQFRKANLPPERGKYSFNKASRVREETLEKYLFVVRLRSRDKRLQLADIGDAVTQKFGHQKMQSPNQIQEKRELESQTSAMFRSAYTIAEWAARLHFVAQTKLNQVCDDGPLRKKPYNTDFDYEFIGESMAVGQIENP